MRHYAPSLGLLMILAPGQVQSEPWALPALSGTQLPITQLPTASRRIEFTTVLLSGQGTVYWEKSGNANTFLQPLTNGLSITMVEIPAAGAQSAQPARSYFLSRTEVSQSQWRAIALLPKVKLDLPLEPSYHWYDQLPVESITWEEASEFVSRLARLTGLPYRLPTEAEWEYAAHGGKEQRCPFGNSGSPLVSNILPSEPTLSSDQDARYLGLETIPVESGQYSNRMGLLGLGGNVAELTADPWHDPQDSSETTRITLPDYPPPALRPGPATTGLAMVRDTWFGDRGCDEARALSTRERHRGVGFRIALSQTSPPPFSEPSSREPIERLMNHVPVLRQLRPGEELRFELKLKSNTPVKLWLEHDAPGLRAVLYKANFDPAGIPVKTFTRQTGLRTALSSAPPFTPPETGSYYLNIGVESPLSAPQTLIVGFVESPPAPAQKASVP